MKRNYDVQFSDMAKRQILEGGPALANAIDTRFKSRAAFAEVAGISEPDLSRYCAGHRTPSPAAAQGILAALGLQAPVDPVPRSASEEALERRVATLIADLDLERQTNADLRLQVRTLRVQNGDLRKTMSRIGDMALGLS